MPRGSADVNTSRRGYNLDCTYWLVSQEEMKKVNYISRITHDELPAGRFYAKYESEEVNSNQIVARAVMFGTTETSISTEDDVSDIKRNALVMFDGQTWRVETVGKKPIRNNFKFDTRIRFKYYLGLKR